MSSSLAGLDFRQQATSFKNLTYGNKRRNRAHTQRKINGSALRWSGMPEQTMPTCTQSDEIERMRYARNRDSRMQSTSARCPLLGWWVLGLALGPIVETALTAQPPNQT